MFSNLLLCFTFFQTVEELAINQNYFELREQKILKHFQNNLGSRNLIVNPIIAM